MGKLDFPSEVIDILNRDRFHHPHPEVRRRMMVVWMCSQRRKQLDCAQIAGVSQRTVRRYIEGFEKGGLDWLRDIRWKGHQSCLTAHAVTLEAEFKKNPPWTVAQAGYRIEKLCAVQVKPTQVRMFCIRSISSGARWQPYPFHPRKPSRNMWQYNAISWIQN